MRLQRLVREIVPRFERPHRHPRSMTRKSARPRKAIRDLPQDHLPPGDARGSEVTAQPAFDPTGGGAEGDALRGKSTRSPAETAKRPHLEGSEQGPV